MKTIREILPQASQDCVDLNPAPSTRPANKNELQTLPRLPKPRSINKTEAEFAAILEAMKRRGEILRYEFEGITLRWQCGTKPDGTPIIIKYTPDFVAFSKAHTILHCDMEGKLIRNEVVPYFIEVKGPFIKGNRERAVERFRHAKTYWSEFTFELHQKTKNGWSQIL